MNSRTLNLLQVSMVLYLKIRCQTQYSTNLTKGQEEFKVSITSKLKILNWCIINVGPVYAIIPHLCWYKLGFGIFGFMEQKKGHLIEHNEVEQSRAYERLLTIWTKWLKQNVDHKCTSTFFIIISPVQQLFPLNPDVCWIHKGETETLSCNYAGV